MSKVQTTNKALTGPTTNDKRPTTNFLRINDTRLLITGPSGITEHLALAYTNARTGAQLYCSRGGQFYSLTAFGLRRVLPHFTPAMQKGEGGSKYPKMFNYGNKLCHHLMYEAWIGPRTKGLEIDHINGCKTDWRIENLEQVTPAENRRRAKILRQLRKVAIADNRPDLLPENRPILQLIQIFNQFQTL